MGISQKPKFWESPIMTPSFQTAILKGRPFKNLGLDMFNRTDGPDHHDLSAGGESQVSFPKYLMILFNTINLGVWRWNFSTDELFFDTRCNLIAGYENDEEGFKAIKKNLIYYKDLHILRKKVEDYLTGRTSWYEAEFRMLRKDGTLIWIQEKGVVTEWDKGGAPVLMIGLLQEVSPVNRREKGFWRERLLKENERLGINMEIFRKQFEETRNFSAALFNATPHTMLLFNHSLRLINCTPVTVEYFGFSSKETFLVQFMQFIRTITVAPDPADNFSYIPEQLAYAARYGYCTFEIKILLRGETVPLEVRCKRITLADSFIISMDLMDLSALKNTQKKLIRQKRQLDTLYNLVFLLFSSCQEDFSLAVYQSLQYLGQSVKADRVYIWKNILAGGRLQGAKISEWRVPQIPDHRDQNPISFSYDDCLPNWREEVSDDSGINKLIQDLEAPLARLHGSGDALSLLIVPILLKGEFWGFIGIESRSNECLFTHREESLLKNGGILIASAIDHYGMNFPVNEKPPEIGAAVIQTPNTP